MLTRLDAMAVGLAAWRLGAGRARKEDAVQAGAGVVWHAKPGRHRRRGQDPLFTLHTDEPGAVRAGARRARGRRTTSADRASYDPAPLVIDRIG